MDYLEKFKIYLFSLKPQPSEITVKNYCLDVKHFILWSESHSGLPFDPKQVKLADIDCFKTEKNKDLSIRSLERHTSSLRKFFHFLKMQGNITASPFDYGESKPQSADPYHLKEFK